MVFKVLLVLNFLLFEAGSMQAIDSNPDRSILCHFFATICLGMLGIIQALEGKERDER